MKLTNIKNVVIWTLVLINLLFLAFYLYGIYTDSANKARSLSDLAALFEKGGIALNTRNIVESGVVPVYTTNRKEDKERQLAEALLGDTSKTDEGGNIYNLASAKGRAKFSDGEFDITLSPGVYSSGGDALTAAKSLMRTLQIETASVSAEGNAGSEKVVAVCAVNRLPVFNCRIVMQFRGGSLMELSGKLASDVQQTPDKKTDMSGASTALMLFLSAVESRSITCARIDSVEPGYVLEETGIPGEGSLIPVWRIGTDSGFYTVDTVTRKTEQSIE